MNPFFENTDHEAPNLLRALANESESNEKLVAVANAAAFEVDSSGWALLSPYGDLPHTQGIQRFSREAADALVSRYKSFASRIKRAVVGMPIYHGHPDHPAFANKYPDKTPFGQVADLQAREDGLYWRPVLSEAGAELVEQGKKYPSINWLCKPIANHVYEPFQTLSVGLVENPNIAGAQSLSNAIPDDPDQPDKTTDIMLDELIKLLGLPEGSTAEQVTAAINELKAKAEAEPKEPEPETPDPEKEEAMANAQAENAKLKADLEKAKAALANEQKKTRETLVETALEEGRILANEKDRWLKRLENDFESESKALAESKALPNERLTADLRPGQKTTDNSKRDAIKAAVAKALPEFDGNYDKAFANVKADPAHKALFE